MSGNAVVLVTGANGFLGSEICSAFINAGYSVLAMVRRGANCERLKNRCPDIRYAHTDEAWSNLADIVSEWQPELIVHTAAAMDGGADLKSAETLAETNILKPARLLAIAKETKIKGFLTVGTAWQHYEGAPYNPVNLYAASKQAFDDWMRYYAETSFPCASLHMFDTYGPNDPRPKLVNLLFKLARTGDAMAMSAGAQEIDLIHVSDAARAFVMAAEQMLSSQLKGFQQFACSGGEPQPLKHLVQLAEGITGNPINITWGGREYRSREVMQTWRGGTPVAGWCPAIVLRDGLKEIWQSEA